MKYVINQGNINMYQQNHIIMFSKSELDLFKNPKGITQEWLDLFIRFEDHKRACNAYGIVGAGVYRTHK
tara:strand:- start:345 stop:551 length:207 start_codon:yes stop_codon:yes gene_type:complete